MTQLLCGAALKCCSFAVQTQVIRFERNVLGERPGRIDSRKAELVIGSVIEESRLIQIGTHSKSVDPPGIDLSHDFETIEAQPDLRALTRGNQAALESFHLLPASSKSDP